jgi:hypothetical protein
MSKALGQDRAALKDLRDVVAMVVYDLKRRLNMSHRSPSVWVANYPASVWSLIQQIREPKNTLTSYFLLFSANVGGLGLK